MTASSREKHRAPPAGGPASELVPGRSQGPRSGPLPRLHVLVTEEELGQADRVSSVLEAGGPEIAVHLRSPTLGGADLFMTASGLMERCGEFGCRLVVNDRLDVALAVGAWGVHLKAESMEPEVARVVAGPELVLGRSIHGAAEAGGMGTAPLDYLVLGSVFPTLSHPERFPLTEEAPRIVADGASVPVLAIGGVTPGRVAALLDVGIYGVAVFRGIWEADRPEEAISAYLEILSERTE